MTKPNEHDEEVKPGDLEITSIGSLYKGPWEKKYWSSSRGKDRYPYPVGFQAVRVHKGSMFKMEIQEGPKGPLFLIISADGLSFSGQTPDIAWESFKKKSFLRTKILRGKRFSCGIDGVEFFGLKNSFVQRLLRELVANINAKDEQSGPSSSPFNGASGADCGNQFSDACAYPDQLPNLARPQITKKRSRRHAFIDSESVSRVGLKRPQAQDLTLNADDSKHIVLSDHLIEVSADAQVETKLASSENGEYERVANNCDKEEKPLDWSESTMVERFELPVSAEEIAQNLSSKNIDLCAPDSLDSVQDSTPNSSPQNQSKSTCAKEETETDMITSEGVFFEKPPEGQRCLSNSNASSGKRELDSVGHDIAKSMMAFLLPQAVPLLKKHPRKKKATISPSVNLPFEAQSREENTISNHVVDVKSPVALPNEMPQVEKEEEMQSQPMNVGFAVPDSPNSKPGILESDLDVISTCNALAVVRDRFPRDIYPPINHDEFVGSDTQEFSASHVVIKENKDIFCHDELCTTSTEKPEKSHNYIGEPVLGCPSSPCKNSLPEDIQDTCANSDKMLTDNEIHWVEKDAADFTKGANTIIGNGRSKNSSVELQSKDINVKTEPFGSCSINQAPVKIYTRKRAKKANPSTRSYNGSLSESIICWNFEDDCVPGTDHFPETMSALKTHHHLSSSQDKPQTEDLLASEGWSGGESHCFLYKKTSPKFTSNNAASSFEGNDTSSSDPNVEKGEADCDKDLLEHGRTDFCNNKIPGALEVENNFDESHNNMVFNNELCSSVQVAGCYFHPMPVLSLLLSAQESEIYICVICGSMDTEHTLYTYKVTINGQAVGQPSFIGQMSVVFPLSQKNCYTEIMLERYGLQFTPDGQSLIMLDKIKTPRCRKGRIDCLCSTCSSECYEENALKIVKVKTGYVSVTAKLKTVDNLECVLVCEPSHLVAGGESGRLHLWTMNSTWSAQTEEFAISANRGKSSRIVELKRIPNYASIVISHHCFGEFSLWDISKQILLSVFSASIPSVSKFFPIGLFNWQRKSHASSNSDMKEQIHKIMAVTKSSCLEYNKSHYFISSDEEDSAVWLLVSTLTSDDHHKYLSDESQINSAGGWRLALLANSMMITGSTVEPRDAVIGASSGYGITGTREGVTSMWELSTGAKLGSLHHFKGGSVSCIASTDDSRSGVLAVADNRGQLVVYLTHSKNDTEVNC